MQKIFETLFMLVFALFFAIPLIVFTIIEGIITNLSGENEMVKNRLSYWDRFEKG